MPTIFVEPPSFDDDGEVWSPYDDDDSPYDDDDDAEQMPPLFER